MPRRTRNHGEDFYSEGWQWYILIVLVCCLHHQLSEIEKCWSILYTRDSFRDAFTS